MPQINQQANHQLKICIDCRHCKLKSEQDVLVCTSDRLEYTDLVTGKTRLPETTCEEMRAHYVVDGISELCGRQGAWFEPIEIT